MVPAAFTTKEFAMRYVFVVMSIGMIGILISGLLIISYSYDPSSTIQFEWEEESIPVTCKIGKYVGYHKRFGWYELSAEHSPQISLRYGNQSTRYFGLESEIYNFDIEVTNETTNEIQVFKSDNEFEFDIRDADLWTIKVCNVEFKEQYGTHRVRDGFRIDLINCDADVNIGLLYDDTLEYEGEGFPNSAIAIAVCGTEQLVDDLLESKEGRTEYLVLHSLPSAERPPDLKTQLLVELENILDTRGQQLRKEVIEAETTTVELWQNLKKRHGKD